MLFGNYYQFCTFKNAIFSTHFYLGVWLLAWFPSPPFDSPFSLLGHLYLLPSPSLLCPTLWISLGIPGCGEHLGNWLLARSVSFLLTPPLLLVTSISFPTLLFSMYSENLSGCFRLWTTHRDLIYWIYCSLPFWFPLFSSWSPLSPSSCFSSRVTQWTFLGVPNCEESFLH